MNFIQKIFKNLNSQIKYCQFKSTEHLDESYAGKTDFDLLIHKKDIYKFQSLLNKFKFKRRISSPDKQYFGMEDYIGFDSETGQLYHFHIHYQMIVGKKLKKNHVLEFENIFWDNLKLDKNYNIYIPVPEMELIILILRICLKLDNGIKNAIKIAINKEFIPKNIWDEFEYLIRDINQEKFSNLYKKLDVDHAHFENIFSLLKSRKIKSLVFLKSRNELVKSLSKFAILSNSLVRNAENIRKKAKTNTGSWLSTIGTMIAFVGCDGAGKSTIVKDIDKWLSWKISTKRIYMGKPKKYPVHIKFLGKLKAIFQIIKFEKFDNALNEQIHLFNANKRKKIFLKGKQIIRSGSIVIFDRFPLKEFWSMKEPMDGPRILSKNKNNKKEKHIYSQIEEPQLLFVLNVEIEESLRRKKNQGIEEDRKTVERKFKAIQKVIIEKSHQENVCVIDAMKPYDEVILEIKQKTWESI